MKYTITLVQPPLPINHRHKKVMPLGLLYLAANARREFKDDIDIDIVDAQAHNISYRTIIQKLVEKKPRLIGFTFWTAQADSVYLLSKALKLYLPDTPIVFGGVHPTTLPEEAALYSDVTILGEGEFTFLDIIRHFKDNTLSLSEIAGICYYDEEKNLKKTTPRPFIEDLDTLPFPAWDLLDIPAYNTPFHITGGQRFPVMGSRGCPYNCSYCASPFLWKRIVRWRKPENVLAEMNEIYERFGVNKIHFWDDNQLLFPEYMEKLCQLLIDNHHSFQWIGLSRSHHLLKNKHLLPLLKESGCVGIEMGIESANPRTFQVIQKEESLDKIKESAELMKQHNMYPLFTYMAFNPGETIEGYYYQSAFIEKIMEGKGWYRYFHALPFNIYLGQFATPHPGTRFWKEKESLGKILASSWSDYYHHNVNFIPYSLLNDIPLATTRKIDSLHSYALLKVMRTGQWNFLPSTGFARMVKTFRYHIFTVEFHKRCNGTQTIKEIIHELIQYLRLPEKEAFQWGAITAMVMAQMGLISSALSVESNSITPRPLSIPQAWRRTLKFLVFKYSFIFLNACYPIHTR